MESSNMMRVNARSENYSGRGNLPQDRKKQQRQKIMVLLEAISGANLEAARHALEVLQNFDPSISMDPAYARLSKLLEAGNIYLVQQLAKEIRANFVNALPLHPPKPQAIQSAKFKPDGLHLIDLRA